MSENVSGVTATNTLVYDGDDELLKDTVVKNGVSTSNYLINSTVLGRVLVKVDASGNKDTTYVPLNQLVTALEQKDFQGNPIVRWVTRDASGLQENDRAADPLGNLIHNVQPQVVGPPPYVPFYGPGYMNPSGAAFTEANNYAMSCVLDGVTAPCEQVMRAVNNHTVDPNRLFLSTTGGLADFANAGLGGLMLDLGNPGQVWRNDPVRHSGPPKWRPPKSRSSGGRRPNDPPTGDPRGGEASGHWETYYEIAAFFQSIAVGPQNPQPLPTDLKDKVAEVVNNPKTKCAEFIKKLIANLKGKPFSDDPIKLFERVEKEKGFRLGNTGKYAALAGMPNGKRRVTIRPVGSTADPRLSEHQAYAYAVTALNELMHHAKDSGMYLDRELAVATFPLLTGEQQALHPLPKTSDTDTNSAYFHSLFKLYCRSLTGE